MNFKSEDVRQPIADYFLAPDDPEVEKPFYPLIFKQPSDLDVPIWRYMTIAKLLSLLDNRALFFARLDKLNDPFEGSITKFQKKHRRRKGQRSFMIWPLDENENWIGRWLYRLSNVI